MSTIDGLFQCSSPSNSTGSFVNQPTGSFQNQPETPLQHRKQGISAIVNSSTDSLHPRKAKVVAAMAIERQSTLSAPRGNPIEGFKARMCNTEESTCDSTCTSMHELLSKNKVAVSQGLSDLQAYIQRNTSYEVQKANAISIMITAITVWGKNIMEAALYRILSQVHS